MEVRVCDLPCRFEHMLAVVALIQALVLTLASSAVHPSARVQMQILRANKWQATRHGLDGTFVNPVSAQRQPVREAVRELLEFVRPVARRVGTESYLETIEEILKEGTGAHKMLELHEGGADLKDIIETMRRGFMS